MSAAEGSIEGGVGGIGIHTRVLEHDRWTLPRWRSGARSRVTGLGRPHVLRDVSALVQIQMRTNCRAHFGGYARRVTVDWAYVIGPGMRVGKAYVLDPT